MLKCKIGKEKNVKITCSGTAHELMLETSMLIQQIYQYIHKANPEAAKGYRSQLLIMMLKPESPVWETSETKEDNHENQETH